MNRVKAGEIEKLGLLYERYKKALFAYFFKLTTGDKDSSEDLVQQVFERIIKYKESFRGDGKFVAWLFYIARNVGLDHHKKSKFTEEVEKYQHKIPNDDDHIDDIIKQEQIRLLRFALSKLKFEEREVIVLGKIKELNYKDIGKIMNCTEGSVKVRMHRAIKQLRVEYFELENLKS